MPKSVRLAAVKVSNRARNRTSVPGSLAVLRASVRTLPTGAGANKTGRQNAETSFHSSAAIYIIKLYKPVDFNPEIRPSVRSTCAFATVQLHTGSKLRL
jgi:hypothetical protein